VHCECGSAFDLIPTPAITSGGAIDACPICENREFFVRKDLPQQVGCFAVGLTVVLSSIAYGFGGPLPAFLVLGAASLVDLALYYRLPLVTICYRCQSELRGFPPNPQHGAYDLGRAEEYDEGR
jgi:hypothetical protein